MPVRVLLVEDVAALRTVVAHALRLDGTFDVVGEAPDGTSAIALAASTQPDIVVLDLGLPDLAGHEVLTQLRREAAGAQIVIYSGTHTAHRPEVLAQADAFVSKDAELAYLVGLLGDLGRAAPHSASLAFPGEVGDVARARHFVRDQVRAWGLRAVEDAALTVVSELVTNAIVHAHSGCELVISNDSKVFRVAITDHGGGTPDITASDERTDHGRGLLLVSVICDAWGVEPLDGGKCVWAELRIDEVARGARRMTRQIS